MRASVHGKKSIVYKITNLVNGKFYIGTTTRTLSHRFSEHVSAAFGPKPGNGHFYRALRKWGRASFATEILAECDDAESGFAEEIRLIGLLAPRYNSTLGGDGSRGHKVSAEAREKMSAAGRGKARHSKPHSPETVELLRKLATDRKDVFAQYAALGPASQAKSVVCLSDGSVYASASAAARHFDAPKSAIIELCLRNPRRKTVSGMVFRYISDMSEEERQEAWKERV